MGPATISQVHIIIIPYLFVIHGTVLVTVTRGEAAAEFKHHSAPVTSVEWAWHDPTVFASSGADHQVQLLYTCSLFTVYTQCSWSSGIWQWKRMAETRRE